MSNNLLESLWARVDANVGARIAQISGLLTQAISANAESIAARDAAMDAVGEASAYASNASASEDAAAQSESNAGSSEIAAYQSESNASNHAEAAATSAQQASDARDDAARSAAAFSIYTGTGSPEGKVTAPVGSVYTDTAATNGAIRWIKTNGIGNTGWSVEYGDTGHRNITSLTMATAGNFTIRRSGSSVFINAPSSSFNMDDGARILTLPAGFRPTILIYAQTPPYWSNDTVRTIRIEPNGTVVVRGGTDSDLLNVGFTFLTNDQWPTSLPGTPY